ncbi:helix-turn-helix domain-containing protein [Dietzia sp. 179-F 9C3 NHS]|uniref:helix-turn-helix domain-containing protein n=1 Tax=Dietzia sp. 179-F 9C3 NHS TaxID=3374295 RepID=UPI003879AA12
MISWDGPAVRHWDFPRSATGIAVLVEAGGRLGVEPGTVLRGVGLGPGDLANPDLLVAPGRELTAIRNLRAAVGDRPALAAEVGAAYRLTTFGILGYALLASPTLREVIALTLRFIDLSYILSTIGVRVAGGRVVVRLDGAGLPPDVRDVLVDRDLFAIHSVLGELVPDGLPFTSVAFGGGRPAPTLEAYGARLGVAPSESDDEGIVATFDAAHLCRPLPQGSQAAVAVAEAMCRDLAATRRARGPLGGRVRVEITGRLARGAAMSEVASALGMSPRTLRRHLADEGTSYQRLLDEVRLELAERMLVTGLLSVEDVALRLGYAEASSFIHAYRRLTGTTPARARRPGRSRA